MVKKASWGPEGGRLPCSLPLTEDERNARFCSPFLLRWSGSEVRRWQVFPLKTEGSSLPAPLVNDLPSRQPWI